METSSEREPHPWFVIATGSKSVVPKIPRLDPSRILTNHTQNIRRLVAGEELGRYIPQ